VIDNSGMPVTEVTCTFSSPGTYYWHVKAVDGAGNESGWSSTYEFSIRRWVPMDGWISQINSRETVWRSLDGWSGGMGVPSLAWYLADSWASHLLPQIGFKAIEGWSVSTNSRFSTWRATEEFNARIDSNSAVFRAVEHWSGPIYFQLLRWVALESWTTGPASVPSFWIEEVVGVPVPLPSWHAVDSWTTTFRAPQISTGIELGYIGPGSSKTVDLSKLGGRIMSIKVTVKSSALTTQISSVTIQIDEYASGDTDGLPSKAYPYRWFDIALEGIESEAVDSLEFTFRVEKVWLSWRGIDQNDVSIFSFSDGWKEYKANLIDEDSNYWYYSCSSEVSSSYLIAGVKVEIIEAPTIIPVSSPEAPPPSIPMSALGVLAGIVAALGIGMYLSSWPVRFGALQRKYGRALAGPNYKEAKLKLGELGKRMRKTDRLKLARMARSLYEIPVPKIAPVEKRMAKMERVAVRRLEEFIHKRRRGAPSIPERRRLTQLKRKMAEEEVLTLRRLERFIAKKRREAPISRRRSPAVRPKKGRAKKSKRKSRAKRKTTRERPKRTTKKK